MGRHRAVKFVVIAVAAAAALSAIVMALWNALMPQLFGLHALDYWQALGLLVLCRLLFGRFGRPGWGGPGRHWRRHMAERWAQMTPQEREQVRARWAGGHCGPRQAAPAAQQASQPAAPEQP
jgi:hypothetical protein